MSKAAGIGAVIVVVGAVGGGGYYYMSNKANQELHKTIALIEQSVPGTSLKYESSSIGLFSQSATLNKVVFKDAKGQEYTADTLTFGGVSVGKADNITIDKFHTAINGGTIDIAHVDAKNVIAPADAIIIKDGKIKQIFISKVSLDVLNIQNVNIQGPDKTGGTLASYELKNYGLNKKSDQTLKQLDVKVSADGKDFLKLNLAQIDGLNVANIAELVEQHQKPKTIPGQPEKAVVEGFSAHVDNQDWSMDKFEGSNALDSNGNLKNNVTFSGLKLGTDHNVKLYYLKEMGYNPIEMSGKFAGNYDKSKQQWTVTPFELTIKDMGNLNADLAFNAPLDLSSTTPQEAALSYKFISVKATLKNQGLLQKLLDAQAKREGISADQVKEKWVSMIKQDAEHAMFPVQKQGDEAILQLMNDTKKSLVIEVKPTQPISSIELMGKSQLQILDALNISIKAE